MLNVSALHIGILLAAMLLTGLIVWLVNRTLSRNRLALLDQRLQQQSERLAASEKENRVLQEEKTTLQQQVAREETRLAFLNEQYSLSKRYQKENELLQSQLAMFKAKFQAAEDKLQTQVHEMEQLGERFRQEFKNLAQGILEEKTQKFTLLNEEKISAILNPLRTQLGEFRQKVEDTYDKESKERFSLGKEVQRLIEASQQVSQEANNLTTALKGSSKTQGDWGEMILESLLENSGLTKGREYFVQTYIRDVTGTIIRDENGRALQPDITIVYPDLRKVIIDSKVSLNSWDQYVACTEADTQRKCLQDLVRSIRTHIDALSRKDYAKYAEALDYVLLFIPIEPAFLEAVKTDALLWKYAYSKKILLVSPTNLFAVLKIIADLWKVELQNRHAIEIADKAGELYDKFAAFIENLEIVGKKIGEANTAYLTAFKQLKSGNGNVLRKVEELRKMGANAKKQISGTLFEEVPEEDL